MHLDLLDTVLVARNTKLAGLQAPTDEMQQKMKEGADGEEAKCPVDHKAREAWLSKAKLAGANTPGPHGTTAALTNDTSNTSAPSASSLSSSSSPSTSSSSWAWWTRTASSSSMDAKTSTSDAVSKSPQPPLDSRLPAGHPPVSHSLGTDRIVSSIPRSSSPGPSSCPVNHEQETGADAASGNWIYPSEKMFFEAMRRKGNDNAQAVDMKTVVPIHNAVNERAWAEIKAWEAPYIMPNSTCGGPRLHSFAGDSTKMSPKARFNTLLGYTAPFDRHDWIVDRCGTQVEYVIDFYAGRTEAKGQGKVNFYLDVRPKLNTWEGVKMRVLRGAGLV